MYHPGTVFPAMLKGTKLKNPPQKGVAPFTKVLMHFLGKNYTHLYLDIEIFFPSLLYVEVYNTPEYQNKTAKQNTDYLCSHSVLLRSKSIFLSTFFFFGAITNKICNLHKFTTVCSNMASLEGISSKILY